MDFSYQHAQSQRVLRQRNLLGIAALARTRYAHRNVELKASLNQTIALINKSVMLESTLQNSMSPAMAASLNFSRGLSAQGLN